MKILQLCKKFPYPLKDGESIAVTHMGRALKELGCEITLLSMNTQKHYMEISDLPKDFNHYKDINTVYLDNRIKVLDAFINLFRTASYHVSRYISPAFENALIRLLKEEDFDIVQLETLYLAPYIDIIRKYSNAAIVMRSHNVEHEIWDRIAENEINIVKKSYLRYLTQKLKKFEVNSLNKCDMFVAITERDLQHFKKLGLQKPSFVAPVGLDNTQYLADAHGFNKAKLSIGFIGSLDWRPNIEALDWFLKNVWDLMSNEYPDLSLHIAGRNTPDWLYKLGSKNVFVHGEVRNAQEFINQHPILVVPILSGSGIRVKILEGMLLGRTVITTTVGLEGINAKHAQEVMIADTPKGFMECLRYCYENRDEILRIGQRAQVFASKNYDNLDITKRLLIKINQSILNNKYQLENQTRIKIQQ
ncbi:MAG: glycosyltransferase family 4 protein [Saprospiraceae bacterium]|nr:glycosyltransferase family 4 protein [Saprospiraceae bacterium]